MYSKYDFEFRNSQTLPQPVMSQLAPLKEDPADASSIAEPKPSPLPISEEVVLSREMSFDEKPLS